MSQIEIGKAKKSRQQLSQYVESHSHSDACCLMEAHAQQG